MGIRILVGESVGDSDGFAVLYCSTTERALPWMFKGEDDAQGFLDFAGAAEGGRDLRAIPSERQEALYVEWCAAPKVESPRPTKRCPLCGTKSGGHASWCRGRILPGRGNAR